jgi:hypothetical protein
MSAKGGIIALLVLAAGVYVVREMAKSFEMQAGGGPLGIGETLKGLAGIFDLALYGIAAFIAVLVVVAIIQSRGKKKREKEALGLKEGPAAPPPAPEEAA